MTEPANDNGTSIIEKPVTWTYIETNCVTAASGLPFLADGSIDVIMTDPPYSEYVHTRSRSSSPGSVAKRARGIIANKAKSLGFDSMNPELQSFCAYQFGRLVRRWVLVFCEVEESKAWATALRLAGLEYVRTLAWVKLGGTPQFTGDRPAAGFETVVLAHPPGRKRWNGGGRPNIYSVPIEHGRREHTTQKPLALMEALVRDFTERGETILDPFGGSGTTGVAAKRLGRGFIGMEKDPHWFAVGARRLLRTREQTEIPFISEARKKMRQEALAL